MKQFKPYWSRGNEWLLPMRIDFHLEAFFLEQAIYNLRKSNDPVSRETVIAYIKITILHSGTNKLFYDTERAGQEDAAIAQELFPEFYKDDPTKH